MIRFEQVSKAYLGGRQALQGVNFHLRPAEMAFLTGHSGAGKSTLLKLICGIECPSVGHILFGGHDISRLKNSEIPFLRRQIGMIFQDHNLLMNRTVYDNVAIPLVIAGASLKDIRRRVSAALDKVGLLDKARNFPVQLSGGEKQRIGIARAVVNKPAVLLADEPTGNLDDALSEGILSLFEEFNRVGVTVLMATHDTRLIARRNYRIFMLNQGRMSGGASMANKFNRLMRDNKPAKTLRTQTAGEAKAVKSNVLRCGWKQQWRYAWLNTLAHMVRQPLATLLTVMVIAISLTLPSLCYLVWKNISQTAESWYPTPQLMVYLDKMLDDDAALNVIGVLKQEDGVAKVNYISRKEAMDEFRNWSGFGRAMDMLEENPLPALAIITPKVNFQSADTLKTLRDRIAAIQAVDEVRMDDSWFARLAALTGLFGKVSAIIGILMVIAVFLIIGNSIQLSIFSWRDTINVMKLIGATDGFILRPFLNGGALLGLGGALLSLMLTGTLVGQLESLVANVAAVFGTTFVLHSLNWDEAILLLLILSMIGWFAAWLATAQHLRQFTPD